MHAQREKQNIEVFWVFFFLGGGEGEICGRNKVAVKKGSVVWKFDYNLLFLKLHSVPLQKVLLYFKLRSAFPGSEDYVVCQN